MKNITVTLILLISVSFSMAQDFTLTHDGLTRNYRLHLPASYNPDSIYPLVVNMHGLGSNAIEQEFYSEFNFVADSFSFIVAYPNGISSTWNVSSQSGTDDVGFISALIDTVNQQYPLDTDRVYSTGMSMGGFMSYRLACELSDRIAAIASVTGLQAFFPCNPERPVPVMQFHGTADPVVPYAGVPSTIANWVNYNVCPETPVITELPDIDTTDLSTVTKSYYGPCEASSEVILYTINGGEHTWPGASFYIGITNHDIEASFEIWDFFSKFTLQGSTSVEDPAAIRNELFSVYPNPVSGFATAALSYFPASEFHFRLINMTGKTVMEMRNLHEQRFLIDCTGIPQGFYIAEINSGNTRFFQKITIR